MTTIAVSMVRDEADIIGETVRHMVTQVDYVIVADNGSMDNTKDILEDISEVEIVDDPVVAYLQSQKMSALAERARDMGADWIVPFDADEVWLDRKERRLADALAAVPDDIQVVEAELFDHVSTARDDFSLPPVQRIQWRRRYPAPLPKVAFRAIEGATVHYGNHGVSFPTVDVPLILKGLLEIRHFAYRSTEQVISKIRNGAAAYAADLDIPEDYGGHWRGWGKILEEQGEQAIADLYLKWHWRRQPNKQLEIDGEMAPPLRHDPALLWVPAQ